MSQKIFTTDGSSLKVYPGEQSKQWELRDMQNKVYFTGSAEELSAHTTEMLSQGTYLYKAKRGRRKK